MTEESINFLTTRQLARRWQVSEATIKRWADAGRLHPARTLGGHRRFALSEVLRFQNAHGLDIHRDARQSAALAHARIDEHKDAFDPASQFFEAINQGHEAAATATLLGSYLNGVPLVEILGETVTAAMHRVGDLWQCGELTVADEHLATQIATRAIESLRDGLRRASVDERRALVCAVEDELHEIAVLCVELLLEETGWSVKNMGANTPFYALNDALKKHRPQLICISSTANMALSRNAREYEEFRAAARTAKATVVLGGEGFRDPTIRHRFPADLHAENFQDLLLFLQEK